MKGYFLLFLILISGLISSCGNKEPQKIFSNEGEIVITAEETEVEYLPGEKTKVWAYNGTVPGPEIHANIGDVVRIKYINNLPEPSTLHWHGLELPANMDGSHISQKPVQPGETFVYEFKVNRAATYWYHSHVKPDEHIEKGLHGPFIVHDPKEDEELFHRPIKEKMIVLDDVLLDENYQVERHLPKDPVKRAEYLTNGRIGNYILLNGKYQPLYKVEVGEPIRLRFVNAANSRFFRLSFGDQSNVYRIGGDTGLNPEPIKVSKIPLVNDSSGSIQISDQDMSKGLMLVPGERAEILWTPTGVVGDRINLEWHDIKRGIHVGEIQPDGVIDLLPDPKDGKSPRQIIGIFQLESKSEKSFFQNFEIPSSLRPSFMLGKKDITNKNPLKIQFGHSPGDENGNVMFFAAAEMKGGKMTKMLPFMKLTNDTALNAKIGETRIIEVVNMAKGIHPFHIHGFAFQLLETQYVDMETPENNYVVKNDTKNWKEWKDTILVPGRPGFRMKSKTIIRLILRFADENRAGELIAHGGKSEGKRSGGWMVHCHILEHSRYGMATWLNLWP